MSKLRKTAKGKPCCLRLPGICNRNPETTVLAHINSEYKGVALKSPDICGTRACSSCHAVLDGSRSEIEALTGATYHEIALMGLIRTLKSYIEEGILHGVSE